MGASSSGKRELALAWQEAQAKVARREISPGAFALLHQLAWLIGRYGDPDGTLTLPERWICRRLGVDPKTYRKRRRTLEGAGLVDYSFRRVRGTARFPALSLPFLTGSTAGNSPAVTAGNSPAVTAGNSPAVYIKTLPPEGGNQPPFRGIETDAVRRGSCSPDGSGQGGVADAPPGGSCSPGGSRLERGARPPNPHLEGAGAPPSKSRRPSATEAFVEKRTMGRLRALLGPEGMVNFGGLWRTRVRRDAATVNAVLNELDRMRKEGRTIGSVGGTLNWLWKDFTGEPRTPAGTAGRDA